MRKVLVTGCAGFIGSHLTDKLLNCGYNVIGIDNFDDYYPETFKRNNIKNSLTNSRFSFINGDICNNTDLNKLPNNIDIVVHLAAKSGVRPSLVDPHNYIQNNIGGTQNLLNWMIKNNNKKLVFASSSSIYGNSRTIPFIENSTSDKPISPYAFSKKSCELLNYTYHYLNNLDIINLRLFTVYGPRQRPDLAIRKFADLICKGKPITIFGDGNTGRDYTYIDDIIDGIMKSIEFLFNNLNVYEIINLGNSAPVKLKELVTLLYTILQRKENINYLPMQPGDVNLTFADISKAKELLNYSPQISLEEGLKNFIKWNETNCF